MACRPNFASRSCAKHARYERSARSHQATARRSAQHDGYPVSRADSLRVADYLQHLLLAMSNIADYTTGLDLAAFLGDRKTCDAVVRNLEVIGEACNNVLKHHPEFAAAHDEIQWRFAYEMRNALSHGYFAVDHAIVWQTIQQDIPGLRASVERLIGKP
jgi:uncharacterized protein with HEPN domain